VAESSERGNRNLDFRNNRLFFATKQPDEADPAFFSPKQAFSIDFRWRIRQIWRVD
jgi:hypothetical protein